MGFVNINDPETEIRIKRIQDGTGDSTAKIVREALRFYFSRKFDGVFYSREEAEKEVSKLDQEIKDLEIKANEIRSRKEKIENVLNSKAE